MILIVKMQMIISQAYVPIARMTQGEDSVLPGRKGTGPHAGNKKARQSRAFLTYSGKSGMGIWCPEEDSNLHTLSSTST